MAEQRCAGRPRLAEVEARTKNLVNVAFKLFVDQGYSSVSLEQIARDAHVAVRTIYVKFGGKIGLLNAVISTERERFFSHLQDMDLDLRPIDEILTDFGIRYLELVLAPHALSMQRLVIAEAKSNPELASVFYEAGPAQTIELLNRFFARPLVRAQFRDSLPLAVLPLHLLNCLMGDRLKRLLFDPCSVVEESAIKAQVEQGLALFFHGALRAATC
jgi:AcrR family transcriptional regulator